jgi:hypothetical protein
VQGLVISLPYCYLSTEVKNVVKSHCKRWWLIQTVGRGQISARTSITASTTYSIHNKETLQVKKNEKVCNKPSNLDLILFVSRSILEIIRNNDWIQLNDLDTMLLLFMSEMFILNFGLGNKNIHVILKIVLVAV